MQDLLQVIPQHQGILAAVKSGPPFGLVKEQVNLVAGKGVLKTQFAHVFHGQTRPAADDEAALSQVSGTQQVEQQKIARGGLVRNRKQRANRLAAGNCAKGFSEEFFQHTGKLRSINSNLCGNYCQG